MLSIDFPYCPCTCGKIYPSLHYNFVWEWYHSKPGLGLYERISNPILTLIPAMNTVILIFQSYFFLNLCNLLLILIFFHSELCIWFISKIINHCYRTISIALLSVPPNFISQIIVYPPFFHILGRLLFTYLLFSIFHGRSELFCIFYSRFLLFSLKYSFPWFSDDHLARTLFFGAPYRSSLNYILALVQVV